MNGASSTESARREAHFFFSLCTADIALYPGSLNGRDWFNGIGRDILTRKKKSRAIHAADFALRTPAISGSHYRVRMAAVISCPESLSLSLFSRSAPFPRILREHQSRLPPSVPYCAPHPPSTGILNTLTNKGIEDQRVSES